MTAWYSTLDEFNKPPQNIFVLVKIKDAKTNNNSEYMIAKYIHKNSIICTFVEDDWYDYDDITDEKYVKCGWYANTIYLGGEYSSYYIDQEVESWKYIE